MKNRTEIMAELIVKADWLIVSPKTDHYGNYSSEYKTAFDEYCRLRAELAEVKDGTGMGAEDIERVLITLANAAYHWGCAKGEGRSEKNFNDFLGTSNYENAINKFASQSPKMPTEDLCKCGIPTPDADRECCTICGKLICGE